MIDAYNLCKTPGLFIGDYECSQILNEDFFTIFNDLNQYYA